MQPGDLVAQAVELSETIRQTSHRHAFEAAVRDFTRLLASVPGYAAQAFSADAITALNSLAEGVIERIEQRVSSADDSSSVQLDLVEGVYGIRRALEEIDRWRRRRLSTQ